MGIESDQLVFDYLSRVGDLAQQHQLPSGARMQLVTSLRNEIDRQRARHGTDNPAAVRRILGRLGTPDEVVAAASPDGAGSGGEPAVPPRPAPARVQRTPRVPRPRVASDSAASPPHLAGTDELGTSGGEPDWWRIGPDPADSGIGGFVGGVEIPEILKPPPGEDAEADGAGEATAGGGAGVESAVPARRRWLPGLRRRTAGEPGEPAGAGEVGGKTAARRSLGNPFLLFAAALLVIGTILGSWLALGLGWLLAYASGTLSRGQAKWAVLGLPGAVAGGAAVWLWGRVNGRWGEPIPPGGDAMADVLAGAWPWVLRGAAVATALYLVYRARKS
ncbi:hypothetical protein V1460_03290 [Streptomyces sp. SCSIO 30461]|uniref:hypothetical protein n=1 Tax=Streptomyces sp. SCSIO 30461 TaxID=3118085 RepID=UPI0030D1B541